MKQSGKLTGRVSIVWSLVLFRDEDLSGESDISATAFPLIQEVQAGGVTTGEPKDVITDKLKAAYLKNPRPGSGITGRSLGKSSCPAAILTVSGMTVFSAVGLTGGYTYRGKTARAYVTRAADPEKKKQVVDPNTQVP